MQKDTEPMEVTSEFLSSLAQIPAAQWDALVDTDYPFLKHSFLYGLEKTNCTTAKTGWQPCHLVIRRQQIIVCMLPLYLKSHSYGEYVFDWSWADAWRQCGLEYYPKLVSAIPFTPATGPRICVAENFSQELAQKLVLKSIKSFAAERGISSWHLLFPEEPVSSFYLESELHRREATQFHWFNRGYTCFDDFLATFNSRKRKSLRRERKRVVEQGLELTTYEGDEITAQLWEQFYRFYQLTYAKRSGHGGYLTREFFLETAPSLGDQVVMELAYLDGRAVAGALFFRSADTLYGRYWGCEQEFDSLHFEACYYRGIEYCIANNLQRFDPGAQGEHKIQRGFEPVSTWSSHWIADSRLSDAIGDFTRREAQQIAHYKDSAATLLPFKQTLET